MLQPNGLREKLANGKPTLGTHILLPSPDVAELIGDTQQFDYAEYSAEYSILDMPLLYSLSRAAQCGSLPLMIKLDQSSQAFWAQAAVGAGFHAVLFTDIRSPSDIDACYRSLRADTPDIGGDVGVKLRRHAFTGYESEGYLNHLDEVVFGMMIEKDVAMENLDAVLRRAALRGVDFIQWGPVDFAFSRGQPSLRGTEELAQIEERLIKSTQDAGLTPRIEIKKPEDAERYVRLGVQHFCIGWDRFILYETLREMGSAMRKDVLTKVTG
ncbi:MAG: aldolase/citrate lyase family protein [Planctomycetota bacterium]